MRLIPLVAALPLICLPLRAAKVPQPYVRLKLSDLGVPTFPEAMQSSGASLLTAHFVDSTHLLVTYGLRELVERIPDDPPEHQDRAVGAVLVELPSGKILARARWHLHDYNRYLWELADGRFLLRIQSRLVAIAPLANLASGDAFHQMPFLRPRGNIDAILTSPEGDLVTVETSPIRRRLPKANLLAGGASTTPAAQPTDPEDDDPTPHGPVEYHFLRVAGEGTVEAPLYAVSAGQVRSSSVGLIPINSRGYLSARPRNKTSWALQYDGFDGETRKLSTLDSSCPPLMQFLGPSHFVAFSCRGSDEKVMISEFNFLSHEMWEEPLPGTTPFGRFSFAPQAGRFALSRLVTLGGVSSTQIAVANDASFSTSQDVRVYQSESGDLLLKLTPIPTSPSGENFDMSTDGQSFLIVSNGSIDVYHLPELTKQDREDLAELKLHEPPIPTESRIDMQRILRQAARQSIEPVSTTLGEPDLGITVATTAAPTPAPVAPEAVNVVVGGDSQERRRKPPTLLNPGETVEGGKKAPKPEK